MKKVIVMAAMLIAATVSADAQIQLVKKDVAIVKPKADIISADTSVTAFLINWSQKHEGTFYTPQFVWGMSRDSVMIVAGRPDEISRSMGSFGVHEQWIYERGYNKGMKDGRTKYVYIENGKLTSIQD
jgi:hypothetical protein